MHLTDRPTLSSWLAFAGALLFPVLPAHAAPASSASPIIVELFTSEGCSSCPPADALLRKIEGTHTDGRLIIGISEHVTYWNHLGWSDPYSAEIFTDRQNSYGERFRLDSVYTPQMVVNGTEELVGSDTGALQRAFAQESAKPGIQLSIASATVSGNALKITFSAEGLPAGKEAVIMAVLADDMDRSNVLRGENSGRTLSHVAVARALTQIGTVHDTAVHEASLPLPSSFGTNEAPRHLVLFAQMPGLGAIVGAASTPLPAHGAVADAAR